jgi:hypothetical protein
MSIDMTAIISIPQKQEQRCRLALKSGGSNRGQKSDTLAELRRAPFILS